MKKLIDLNKHERPREKIIKHGVENLSHLDLVCLLVASGTQNQDVLTLSRQVLKIIEDRQQNLSLQHLTAIPGIGLAKGSQILAAFELAKRYFFKKPNLVQNVDGVLALVDDLRSKKQEYFVTLSLDGAHNLIQKRTVFIGTLNESLVHPREVFADAIAERAAGMILVHNHPSGICEPSEEDVAVTKRLCKVGQTVGIPIYDHVIVTRKSSYSFMAAGLIK